MEKQIFENFSGYSKLIEEADSKTVGPEHFQVYKDL